MDSPNSRIIQLVSGSFLFLVALLALFVYGIAVGSFKLPPYSLFEKGYKEYEKATSQFGDLAVQMNVKTNKMPVHYRRIKNNFPEPVYIEDEAYPGINLVTRIAKGSELAVDMVDMQGNKVHSWNVDWFQVWPDPAHVPELQRPRSKPGSHIHGAVVLDNGDLVYNYEHLGLVRLSRSSEVIWRLPYRTHHSVHLHDDGMLWVSGQKSVTETDPRYPHRKAPFDEYTIVEIDPENGAILNEWSVAELLYENGYGNLLFLVPVEVKGLVQVVDDRLHLNDVEPFPAHMKEGFFKQGDVIVSLRNVSTVFVFNKDTGKIKYITTGIFSQQHDPDFIDGNRFSVFDNNTRKIKSGARSSSRIVVVTAPQTDIDVVFEGVAGKRFYTPVMGKHQWLPNGNILITESIFGRAFEINPQDDIVWQYVNKVGDNIVALVEEVSRYPLGYAGFVDDDEVAD